MTQATQAQTIVDRLWHPESPIMLDDGGILFVEADTGRVAVHYPDGLLATFAVTGGRPYGCLFGSDGRLYVAQSGSDGVNRRAPRRVPPSLQRVSSDGAHVETLATEADGIPFIAPNSLVWDTEGRLWMTDSGHWDPDERADPGRIYRFDRAGRAHVAHEPGNVFPNGIAAEADGSMVWVESYTRRIGRILPGGATEIITTLDEGHTPEAIKLDARGRLWVANFEAGGIDVLERDGTPVETISTGGVPINFLWHDGLLDVVDFGTEDTDVNGIRPGRIVRLSTSTTGAPTYEGLLPEQERHTHDS
ncbi:SMP-30/gluconolactonase/LRE family protein [Leifsonia shinshuensis]|uniref:SMP-30/gluconolactonase/LRE family protein n=1 Tax=Leifsonia shinshuensis TaxID=150026 RepID=A0A7G6YA93_9MICO|nr:SMP-30/gluconolactonase/LRE family protein [Leifsonia shinshuensis]QNE35408.1 SMP-30/gluconolactonase/LRE family protein [Leifsonia shinshuensis]